MKIAIDGPAGSGKSTVAKALAAEMNLNYLDTGAMYRTVAYYFAEKGIDVKNAGEVEKNIADIDIDVKYENGMQHMYSCGKDITGSIRTPEISMGASDVSKHPCVRIKLVEMQRDIARRYDIVMDGRDIGTYVLPDADFKFYITASSRERAKRRQGDFEGRNMTLDEIEQEIIMRDKNDMEREFAPLKQAEDAVYVDTTEMGIDEVVEYVSGAIRKG